MASETDRRASDFAEITKAFAQHPRISVTQTEGEPPDCYEIEYHCKGLVRNADGTVGTAAKHVVLITLPFGYPHFPPAVKPLTQIFHPDIDPDAVRISSFWQQTPSLPKLILHIEEIICGKVYNLDDPFNQEAADWYAEHSHELPFEEEGAEDAGAETHPAPAAAEPGADLGLELDLSELAAAEEDESGGLGLELELGEAPEQEDHGIGLELEAAPDAGAGLDLGLELGPAESLHQDEQSSGLELEAKSEAAADDLDFGLDLEPAEAVGENSIPDISLPAEAEQEDLQPRLDAIRAHIAKKELTIAGRLLAELPVVPAAEELRKKVKTALAERDALLAELKVLEDEDNFAEAENVFKKIKKIAVDTPGLAEIGRRLQQSQTMLDTFAKQKKPAAEKNVAAEPQKPLSEPPPAEEQKKKPAQKPVKKTAPPPAPPAEKPKQERSSTRAKIVRHARREVPAVPILAALGMVSLILSGGLLYTKDSSTLQEAGSKFFQAQTSASQQDFKAARPQAETALFLLNSMFVPFLGQDKLKEKINELINSEEFRNGEQGKGKYKDQYVPLEELKNRQELDKLIAAAKALEQGGDLDKAIQTYDKTRNFAVEKGLNDAIEELTEKLKKLGIERKKKEIDELKDDEDCKKKKEILRQYLELIKEQADQKEKKDIQKKLNDLDLSCTLEESKRKIDFLQWKDAVEKLEQALQRLKENSEPALAEKQQEIEHLLAHARFFLRLSTAFQLYNSKDAAASIKEYEAALQVLRDNRIWFGEKYGEYVDKITRTVVNIKVDIKLNEAKQAEQEGDVQKALRLYEEIEKLLEDAGEAKDERQRALLRDVQAKIESMRQDMSMRKKDDWLNRNYKRIFPEAYPHIRPERLGQPQLIFIKKINGKELCKITCLEDGTYRLILHYLYDPATDQWTRYTGPVDSDQ